MDKGLNKMWQKWIQELVIKFDNLKKESEYDKGYHDALRDVLAGIDDISPWRAHLISPRDRKTPRQS